MTFSGHVIRQFSTDAGSIAHTSHGPANVEPHAHAQLTLCLVTRGEVHEARSGGTSRHGARALIFRQPGERHANAFGSVGARCFNVALASSLFEVAPPPLSPPAAIPIVQRLRRELNGETSRLVVEGLLLQLAGEIARVEAVRGTMAEKTAAIVRERFTDSLHIQSIAAELGAHPVHVARAFQREFGRSIGEVVRDLRIDRARELLRGSRPLSEVALACGFADQSHFTRVFHEVTGVTPRRFRLTVS